MDLLRMRTAPRSTYLVVCCISCYSKTTPANDNLLIVPLEAVSGVLRTNSDWEDQITKFWDAQKAVFKRPDGSTKCGTHVHITPGSAKKWSLPQLKRIAIGIIRYEDLIRELLISHRRTLRSSTSPERIVRSNFYCQSNSSSRSSSRDRGSFQREDSPERYTFGGIERLVERVGRIGISTTHGTHRSPRVDLLAELQRRIPNMTVQDIKRLDARHL